MGKMGWMGGSKLTLHRLPIAPILPILPIL
jgi:hypothetical protein